MAKSKKKLEKPVMGRPVLHTAEYIAKITQELIDWSMEPEAIFIDQFTSSHKDTLSRETFDAWCTKSEHFSDAYSNVKRRLLNKIKLGSLMRAYDGNFASKILPLIDPEYRAWRREELKLAAETEKDKTIRIIVDQDRTPEKKEE